MGKHRGRDEDVLRQQQQSPFPRNAPQIQMTSSLAEVLDGTETFFHSGQQSNKMLLDNSRRMRLSHELQRRSFVDRLVEQGVDPANIPPVEVDVNPSEVTVTMQIYQDEYTELFQRRLPDNLSSIMRDTDTLIRFPDPDDESPFACQVSINGQMPNVENARRRLRDLCHLSITFPFEENKHNLNATEIADWIDVKYMENAFPCPMVIVRTLAPHNRQSSDKLSINVMGTLAQEKEVIATIRMITEQLFKPAVADKLEFFTELSVPISQLDMYLGGEQAAQLLAVAKNTNASLHFLPNPRPRRRFHHFLITGKPEAIITAFKVMTALQPVQLSLNARSEDVSFSLGRGETWKHFNSSNSVHTSICPSALQPSTGLDSDPIIHFLCFTAQEHNMGGCYEELVQSLRRGSPLANLVPQTQTSSYMEPIRPHIGDISKYLDIINRNQPAYMSLGGDIDALVPSYSDAENGDCESIQDLEILRRGTGDMTVPDGDNHSHMRQQYGFRPRDDRGGRRFGGSSRSSMDGRSESGSYTRPFSRNNYTGSFRGNRNRQMSGGDRRWGYYGGRGGARFDRGPPRDRANNVKSELQLKPKTNDTNGQSDGHYSNNGNKNYVFTAKEGGDHFHKRDAPRNYRGHHPRNSGPDSPAYTNYYPHPNANWSSSHDKVFLKRRTSEDMPSPNELNRRMNAMDLIKQASAEQPVFPEDYDSAGRATYAEILEGNCKRPADSKGADPSQEREFRGRQKSAQHSYSATAALPPSVGGASAAYPSYSPFASGVNYLDRRVDVDHVLFSLNCTKYIESFHNAKIKDLRSFSMLTENDLIRIGVNNELDRKTILSYAIRLRTTGPPPPATSSRSGPSICA